METLANNMREKIAAFEKDLELYLKDDNKSAARRARKASIELEKMFKQFRKDSI